LNSESDFKDGRNIAFFSAVDVDVDVDVDLPISSIASHRSFYSFMSVGVT